MAGQTPDLLVPASPGLTLKTTAVFPLIPFAGFTAGSGDQDLTTNQLAQLERQNPESHRRSRNQFRIQPGGARAPQPAARGWERAGLSL